MSPSSYSIRQHLGTALGIAFLGLALAGCAPKDEEQIRVDKVAKEVEASGGMGQGVSTNDGSHAKSPMSTGSTASTTPGTAPAMGAPGMQALPGMAAFTAATPTPQWTPPADWTAVPLTTTRKGSWVAPASAPQDKQAEISVTVFQGNLGGLLANVNRWRGQVGLDGDLTDATLAQNVQNITLDGRAAQLVTLDGPAGKSLDGVLVILPDRVWSLVLRGNTDVVKSQRAAFRAFLDSIKWQG